METCQDDLLQQLRKLSLSEQEAKMKVITTWQLLHPNTGAAADQGYHLPWEERVMEDKKNRCHLQKPSSIK